MKKWLVGAALLMLAVAVIRRFGPTLAKRAIEECRELMAGGGSEARGFEDDRTQLATSKAG